MGTTIEIENERNPYQEHDRDENQEQRLGSWFHVEAIQKMKLNMPSEDIAHHQYRVPKRKRGHNLSRNKKPLKLSSFRKLSGRFSRGSRSTRSKLF
ncbi:hypothetical protein EVAR_32697_1 [Eumeta japonica]|uniref:Uncharacterized protein n=1 Tax=Eumeta variegata TaxID=151549 RepID=A0A4C1VS59_EUMVA|nr:hypothetical protein EVAR_32697_1 [Eumeta japonica]